MFTAGMHSRAEERGGRKQAEQQHGDSHRKRRAAVEQPGDEPARRRSAEHLHEHHHRAGRTRDCRQRLERLADGVGRDQALSSLECPLLLSKRTATFCRLRSCTLRPASRRRADVPNVGSDSTDNVS